MWMNKERVEQAQESALENLDYVMECCEAPIGEGDFICCECDEPVVVVSNYTATKDYLKCRSRKFKKQGRQKCA